MFEQVFVQVPFKCFKGKCRHLFYYYIKVKISPFFT